LIKKGYVKTSLR